jgi:pantoate--beta-alanine ligase
MFIFHHTEDLKRYLTIPQKRSKTIGFVPTMGALHQGHISLIQQSKKLADITVSSVFVNPTQFNDPKDYQKYPVTLDADIARLAKGGCDVLFLPAVTEIYPGGTGNLHHYNLGYLETVLEGKYRPGHFQGVCQVVHRLLNLIEPDILLLGQKDYQQCMVIKKMVALTGIKTKIEVCPTLREADGLAMSSRNMRLSPAERQQATEIYKTLQMMKNELKPGNIVSVKQKATAYLQSKNFRVDYTEFVNGTTLELMNDWNGADKVVAIIAAFCGEIRLIDNLVLNA